MRSRFVLGLLLGLLAGGAAGADTNAFTFVQISDTHFAVADHDARTRRLIERINNLPMDVKCVIHTGDVFSDNIHKPGRLKQGMAILEELDPPIYALPGNHDIMLNHLAPTLAAYTNDVGPLAYTVEVQGVVFALVYTEALAKNVTIEGYDVIDWLSRTLKSAGREPVIVCHHRPSSRDFYRNRMHDAWDPEGLAAWKDVLKAAPNVVAVLTGHYHRDELHWIGHIPSYSAASVAGFWGRQGSLRIYEYENGKLGYRTMYLE